MVVPVINFAALPDSAPIPDFSQLGEGFQQGLKSYYAPKMMNADLEKAKLANALSAIQAQYLPKEKQANIANTMAQTGLLGEQTKYYGPNIESEIGLRGSQANLTNEQAKYLPLDTLIKALQSQTSQSRFGTAYQLSKAISTMPQAARDTWIANNQGAYTDMLNTLGNKALQQQEGQGNDMLSNALAQFYPGLANKQKLPQSSMNVAMLQQNAPTQMTIPTSGQQPNQFSATPDQISELANINKMSANQSLTTAATRTQAEGSQQVESVINDPGLNARAQNAFKYAGIANKPKEVIDSFNRSNPKTYEDYLTFVNNDMILIESRIKGLDKIGATNEQRQMLQDMWDKTMFAITSNSPRAADLFKNLKESIANVSRGVLKSAQPIGDTGRYSANNHSSYQQPSYSDSARNYNLATGRLE